MYKHTGLCTFAVQNKKNMMRVRIQYTLKIRDLKNTNHVDIVKWKKACHYNIEVKNVNSCGLRICIDINA